MPGYLGAGAEFIVHPDHQKTAHQAILLPEDSSGRMLLGHMYGGIASPMQHAFFNYETSSTYADSTIYAVYLNTNSGKSSTPVSGVNPYSIKQASFNSTQVAVSFDLAEPVALRYYMTNADGFIVLKGSLSDLTAGANTKTIAVESGTNTPVSITLVFDDQWFVSSSLK
jgi:hypothetical protein